MTPRLLESCVWFLRGEKQNLNPIWGVEFVLGFPGARSTEADAMKAIFPILHHIQWRQVMVNGQHMLPPVPSPHGS